MSQNKHIGEIIRNKLRSGKRVYGTHVFHQGGPVTMEMASALNLDFVFLDTEHTPADRSEISFMCRKFAHHGISPIVRISYPNGHLASMAIDGGAHGIVVPYIETVDEVKEIVGAVKYRPIKGKFLKDIVSGSRKPNQKTSDYLQQYNRNQYVIIGVESVEACQNLDALLAVDGVDCIFMGPHDISVSMEIPEEYTHPDFLNLVTDVIKRSRKAGLGVGIHFNQNSMDDVVLKRFLDAGMNWILYSHDLKVMSDAMTNDLNRFRNM